MSDLIVPITCQIAVSSKPTEDPVWTDVSAYLLAVPQSVRRGRDRVTQNFDAGDCRVLLDNKDRRFEPGLTTSPYYPNLKTTRRLRLGLRALTPVTDSFDRADTASGLGVADTGQAWVYSGGGDGSTWRILGNRALRPIISGESAALIESGSSDVMVQVTNSNGYGSQDLIWRSNAGTGGAAFRLGADDATGTTYQVKRWNSLGSTTVLYDTGVLSPHGGGDVMKVICVGPIHRIYINGVLVLTFTDSTNLYQTYHGIFKAQGSSEGGQTHDAYFDDFSIAVSSGGDIFDGYIESIECEYETELEGVAIVTAVDGFKAANLMAPDRYSGVYDSFNRANDAAITVADSGQTWHAAAGTWKTEGQMAQCDPASTVKDGFVPGSRDTFTNTPIADTDTVNRLNPCPSGQTWIASSVGSWLIHGTASAENYAFVADWLTHRTFYETPANADAAGFFKVVIDPVKPVTTYLCRLTLGVAPGSANTGSMMGFTFLGGDGDNYWALLFEDRTLVGTVGAGVTLVRVQAGVPTYYRKFADIWPGGPNNPLYDASFNFSTHSATYCADVLVEIDSDRIKVTVTPVAGSPPVNDTPPDTTYTSQVAYCPLGGFAPGYQCGLIHNGVLRLAATNSYQWGAISASGPGLLWLESSLSDGTVESLIKMEDSRLTLEPERSGKGVLFRYSDDQNYWFAHVSPDGTGSPVWLRLWKVVDGSFSQEGSYQLASSAGSWTTYSLTDRTLNKLRVTLAAGSIRVAWYGTVHITVSDTFNVAATKHGLYHGNALYYNELQDEVDWDATLVLRANDDFRVGRSLGRQLSGERVDALLDILGWRTADRSIAPGTVYLAPLGSSLDLDTKTVLDHIREAVEAEHGAFYFNASGIAVFEDRNTRLSLLTVEQTLEDIEYSAQTTIPYLPGVRLKIDDASLYNEVKITAALSETKFFSGVLTTGTLHSGYATGATTGTQDFTVRYVTRAITLGGAPSVTVRFYEADDPWGPYSRRTDLEPGNLVANDEVDITLTGVTKAYKAFQLYWPSSGPPSVDLDVYMSSVPAQQTAIDVASIQDHFKRTWGPKTLPLTSDADALALAGLILVENRESLPRIDQVRCEAISPARADSLIALDISSRVQVLKHFPDGSPYFTQVGFVEGIRYEFGDNQLFLNYSLSQQNAGLNAWILDDPILSVLDLTTRLT